MQSGFFLRKADLRNKKNGAIFTMPIAMPVKVLLLSDSNSEHTEKWALGLASRNIEVGLFSFNKSTYHWYESIKNIKVLYEPGSEVNANTKFTKLNYLGKLTELKKAIREFRPDVLHAHYATSYGLIGALTGFHPYVISSWGTDVMKFPQKNFLNRSILKYNLRKADVLCATSFTIRDYINEVIQKDVKVIPFGADTEVFRPKEVEKLFSADDFVVGSVKPFEKLYNIDVIIKSFALLSAKYANMKLLLIGRGREEATLKELCKELKIEDKVKFTGRVNFSEVSNYFNMLDVLVNISDYESFGVAVIEAMACEKPVVVTGVGGLKEIVENETYGTMVKVDDVPGTAAAVEKYYLDKELKIRTGKACRQKVMQKYNWNDNIRQMEEVYNSLLKR